MLLEMSNVILKIQSMLEYMRNREKYENEIMKRENNREREIK